MRAHGGERPGCRDQRDHPPAGGPADWLDFARQDAPPVNRFSSDDPERQATIAFALIFVGILAVGGITIWLFYVASF